MNSDLTYNDYLKEIDSLHHGQDELLKNQLLYQANYHPSVPEPIGVIPFVIDYSQKTYLYLGNNIGLSTGYEKELFLKFGINQMTSIVQQDDFMIFNQKIFPSIIKFLGHNNKSLYEQFTFSFNYRVLGKNNVLTCFWQQCKFVVSPSTKLPIYCIGSISDITRLKRGNTIVFSIEELDDSKEQKKLHHKIIYSPNEEDLMLTKKEKEIVDYLAKGLSTKQISEKTGLCKNTVKNHRQNMMQKTDSKNTVELVAFAIRNRII